MSGRTGSTGTVVEVTLVALECGGGLLGTGFPSEFAGTLTTLAGVVGEGALMVEEVVDDGFASGFVSFVIFGDSIAFVVDKTVVI